MRLFTTRRTWTAPAVKQFEPTRPRPRTKLLWRTWRTCSVAKLRAKPSAKVRRAGELRGWAHGASGCFPTGGAAPGNVVPPRSCPAPPACPAVPTSPRRRARSLCLEGQGPARTRGGAEGKTSGLRPSVHTWPIEGVTVNKWRPVQLPMGRDNAPSERAS